MVYHRGIMVYDVVNTTFRIGDDKIVMIPLNEKATIHINDTNENNIHYKPINDITKVQEELGIEAKDITPEIITLLPEDIRKQITQIATIRPAKNKEIIIIPKQANITRIAEALRSTTTQRITTTTEETKGTDITNDIPKDELIKKAVRGEQQEIILILYDPLETAKQLQKELEITDKKITVTSQQTAGEDIKERLLLPEAIKKMTKKAVETPAQIILITDNPAEVEKYITAAKLARGEPTVSDNAKGIDITGYIPEELRTKIERVIIPIEIIEVEITGNAIVKELEKIAGRVKVVEKAEGMDITSIVAIDAQTKQSIRKITVPTEEKTIIIAHYTNQTRIEKEAGKILQDIVQARQSQIIYDFTKKRYEATMGIVNATYGKTTEIIVTISQAAFNITFTQYLECMKMLPDTIYLKLEQSKKDFGIRNPHYGTTYSLCLRKKAEQRMSTNCRQCGVVDFTENTIQLNGLIEYLRRDIKNELMSSVMRETYKVITDANATMKLDKQMMLITEMTTRPEEPAKHYVNPNNYYWLQQRNSENGIHTFARLKKASYSTDIIITRYHNVTASNQALTHKNLRILEPNSEEIFEILP